MSLIKSVVIVAIFDICLGYYGGYLVSDPCRSVDWLGEPWLPLDVCSNSYSTKYQGTYSEMYICNEEGTAINTTVYWGHDCIGRDDEPAFSTQILSFDVETYCYSYNYTYNSGWDWWDSDWYWSYNYSNYTSTSTTAPPTPFNTTNYNVTRNVTLTPGDDDDTYVVTYCYNSSYVGLLTFNCDKSLPICLHTNYTYLEPLPEEKDCVRDKSKANWDTDVEVINQCLCYDWVDWEYNYDDGTWEYENSTYCNNYLCDEDGIWEIWYDYVNTSLPQDEWCADSMEDVYENETTGEVYVYEYISAGCDKDLGQWMVVEYCPDDENIANNNINQCLIALLVSLLVAIIVYN